MCVHVFEALVALLGVPRDCCRGRHFLLKKIEVIEQQLHTLQIEHSILAVYLPHTIFIRDTGYVVCTLVYELNKVSKSQF